MIGQPHEMAIGPPLLKPWPKVVKQPARMEMIEADREVAEPGPGAFQLLLVTERGEMLLVVGQVRVIGRFGHGTLSHGTRSSGGVSKHPRGWVRQWFRPEPFSCRRCWRLFLGTVLRLSDEAMHPAVGVLGPALLQRAAARGCRA